MVAHLSISTIRKRSDFLRLNRGQKYITDSFILRALPRLADGADSGCRIGYTVTTKCGNAVIRNRIKRRLRALVGEILPVHGRVGVDYVIIARADAVISPAECDIASLSAQLEKAVTAINRKFPA